MIAEFDSFLDEVRPLLGAEQLHDLAEGFRHLESRAGEETRFIEPLDELRAITSLRETEKDRLARVHAAFGRLAGLHELS